MGGFRSCAPCRSRPRWAFQVGAGFSRDAVDTIERGIPTRAESRLRVHDHALRAPRTHNASNTASSRAFEPRTPAITAAAHSKYALLRSVDQSAGGRASRSRRLQILSASLTSFACGDA